jgi:hypothetical protein
MNAGPYALGTFEAPVKVLLCVRCEVSHDLVPGQKKEFAVCYLFQYQGAHDY